MKNTFYEVSFDLTGHRGIRILESLNMSLLKIKNKDKNYHWTEWTNGKNLEMETQYNPYSSSDGTLGHVIFKSKSNSEILYIQELINDFLKYIKNKKIKKIRESK